MPGEDLLDEAGGEDALGEVVDGEHQSGRDQSRGAGDPEDGVELLAGVELAGRWLAQARAERGERRVVQPGDIAGLGRERAGDVVEQAAPTAREQHGRREGGDEAKPGE